jgi:hypothetical protein
MSLIDGPKTMVTLGFTIDIFFIPQLPCAKTLYEKNEG